MKKRSFLRALALTFLAAALSAPALAAPAPAFSLPEAEEFSEISQLSGEICGWVNSLIEENGDNVPPVTPEQLDFSAACRIDTESTVFKQNLTSAQALTAALEQADSYLWELPVSSGDQTYVLTLTVGAPVNPDADLTEQDRQYLLEREGKWHISGITADGDQPYIGERLQALAAARDGSVCYVMDADSHCTFAILSEADALTSAVVLRGSLSVTDQRTQTAKQIAFAPETFYPYDGVRQVLALAEPVVQAGTDGGLQLVIPAEDEASAAAPLGIALACAAALAVVLLVRSRRHA